MAKTIKFNLVCDNHQVRTLEDLRNYFSIEDVLQYYKDKILEKWLDVRGYNDELEAVRLIKLTNPNDIIKALVRVFNVEIDEQKIDYVTSVLEYREKRVIADRNCVDRENLSHELLANYFLKYEELKNEIKNDPFSKSKIQAIIHEIEMQYQQVFDMDYRKFFYDIRDVSPIAILCLLMNSFTRKYYIVDDISNVNLSSLRSDDMNHMVKWIKERFSDENFLNGLGDNVIKFEKKTESRWITLEKDKRCLVILLKQKYNTTSAISNEDSNIEYLDLQKVNGKFPILKGLQYQSSAENNTLYYIEI